MTLKLQVKIHLELPAVKMANFSILQVAILIVFPSLSRPTIRFMPSSINDAWNSFAPYQPLDRDVLSGQENR